MANIIRWDPWRDAMAVREALDRAFEERMFRPPVPFGPWSEGSMSVDMYETEDSVVVKTAIPGVKADDIEVSVDVLSQPERCDVSDLDPSRYGVIVEHGRRRGLLLPDLPGVDSVADQVDIACRKAGIDADEPYALLRFTVERHTKHA